MNALRVNDGSDLRAMAEYIMVDMICASIAPVLHLREISVVSS